jgi:hypothetical protein
MTVEGWMFKPGEGRKLLKEIAEQKLDYITEKTLKDDNKVSSNPRFD